MVEKASRMTNILSVERDWVPVLANAEDVGYSLTHLNTAMRRIDIACKFVAPLAISAVVAIVKPAWSAVLIALVSSFSVVMESWIVIRVWKHNNRLQAGKVRKQESRFDNLASGIYRGNVGLVQRAVTKCKGILSSMAGIVQANVDGLCYYFSTTVWLPSICVAVLHGSVLAWSGTLITWLLNEHFSLAEITTAKAIGSVFEIGSTIVFPWAVNMLLAKAGSQKSTTSYQMIDQTGLHDYDETGQVESSLEPADKHDKEMGKEHQFIGSRQLHIAVIDVASWSLSALSLILIPTVISLFVLNHSVVTDTFSESQPSEPSPLYAGSTTVVAAIAFWSFLSLSFVGRWTYDLAATQMTQMLVPSTHRSAFGGTEQAVVSMVSLIHWVAAAIWHQQSDFIWLALASAVGVSAATISFVAWARQERSHGMSM